MRGRLDNGSWESDGKWRKAAIMMIKKGGKVTGHTEDSMTPEREFLVLI